MSKKRPVFSRGYKECREKLNNGSVFVRSCFNCVYYYQEYGDIEEVCQNDSVLEYDMVTNNNSIYCLKWLPCHYEEASSSMFRRGRSILD